MRPSIGSKLVTLDAPGPVLLSADVHGNFDDFARLREIFLSHPETLWVSVGDWVHGPADGERRDVTSDDGELLYDYPDRTPELLEQYFALMDEYPGRVVSLVGNHEHAHIGGKRTHKFHDDEAAHLERLLGPARSAELRERFASWPLFVRMPSCAIVVTHGAPIAALEGPADVERVAWGDSSNELLQSAMTNYGFLRGEDGKLLARLCESGQSYQLIVHGHDRCEQGWERSAESALLLCTSFGAKRLRKAYLWLDGHKRYRLADLGEGEEIRFLWG